jgi:hypothetical protein
MVTEMDPVLEDNLLAIVFEPIKQQLKRDLKKFETCSKEFEKNR